MKEALFAIAVLAGLGFLIRKAIQMSEELDLVKTEVTEAVTVMQGAATLITSLAEQIRQNVNDPEVLLALAADLDSGSNSLAAAIAANTPGAEQPTEPTEPEEPVPDEGDEEEDEFEEEEEDEGEAPSA